MADATEQFAVPDDKMQDFVAWWNDLASVESNVNIEPIPISQLCVDGRESVITFARPFSDVVTSVTGPGRNLLKDTYAVGRTIWLGATYFAVLVTIVTLPKVCRHRFGPLNCQPFSMTFSSSSASAPSFHDATSTPTSRTRPSRASSVRQ